MNTFEKMITDYLEELTETMCYVVDCYTNGKTNLPGARTYYNFVLDAYRAFKDAYTMPNDVKELFASFGTALSFDEFEIRERLRSLEA